MSKELFYFEDVMNKATAQHILSTWNEITLKNDRDTLRKKIEDFWIILYERGKDFDA